MSAHLGEVLVTDSKASLTQLSKIPAKEFEMHFREWLERDDVARSLQAKLRADLILNFNKTALGKQLLSQSASSLGGSTHRLTLSPLILALNSLVAEFLYAVNCHFSLSVFSTEVPFRNTLPDFESSGCFRFTEREIVEIFEALSGNFRCEPSVKYKVAKSYANSGTTSLLMLIVKNLMQRVCLTPDVGQPQTPSGSGTSPRHRKTKTMATSMTPPPSPRRPITPAQPFASARDGHHSRHEIKPEINNTNFRYLNKYLLILAKKVKEMCEQFESLREMKYSSAAKTQKARLPLHKSSNTRKFENLNRSLELITKNLRQMNDTKRRSKQVGAIVTAIDTLSSQFQQCAVNFEKLTRGFVSGNETVGSRSHREARASEKQTNTKEFPEKSYSDWVQEMRNSQNGQKFLDRVESSVSKTLSKQRARLEEELAIQLKHQRQLLRVHYKQKLIEKLSQKNSTNGTLDSDKLTENIDKQLKQFEEKHVKLLQKVGEAEREAIAISRIENNASKVLHVIREQVLDPQFLHSTNGKVGETSEPNKQAPVDGKTVPVFSLKPVTVQSCISQPTETSCQADTAPTTNDKSKDMLMSTMQIGNIVKEIAEHDRNVEDIISGAKQRIQELENVGNELDRNFRDYLQRQKMQKDATHEVAERMCQSYISEREKLRANIKKMKESSQLKIQQLEPMTPPAPGEIATVTWRLEDEMKMSSDSASLPTRNPILEAKEKFFSGKPMINLPEQRNETYIQSHYYNEKGNAMLNAAIHSEASPPSAQQTQVQPPVCSHFSIAISSSGSSTTKSTSSISSHLSSITTTTNSSDVSNNNNNNKYVVHSKERPKNPIEHQRQLFNGRSEGRSGKGRAQVLLANQNNRNGSSVMPLTTGPNKNTNLNGTTEMHVESGHRNSNNNNNTNESIASMMGGITIYSVSQGPEGGLSQIRENKRPTGYHAGINTQQPSTLALQQSMMKMKRLFSQRPVELSNSVDVNTAAENGMPHVVQLQSGVNEVEVDVASGSYNRRVARGGRGGGAVASPSTTTLKAATVSTAQQRHGKHLADAGVGAVTQPRDVEDDVGVGAVATVNNNNVPLRTNNTGHEQTMAAEPKLQEPTPADVRSGEDKQSINDLVVLHISDNNGNDDDAGDDDGKNKTAKFDGVLYEEGTDDDVDGVFELGEDDSSLCEVLVSFEDVDENSNDDDDDNNDLNSGTKLKRTEAQMSFARPPQSTGTGADMERALKRILADGNDEIEIGEVIIAPETTVAQHNAEPNASTTESSVDMKLSVAGRSGSGSGSDFWN